MAATATATETDTETDNERKKKFEKRMSSIRGKMLLNPNLVFFGVLCMNLEIRAVSDGSIGTAGTDGTRVFYELDFCEKMSDEELIFLTAHETLHVALRHTWRKGLASRLGGRDKARANVAADYVINLMLAKSGIRVLEGALLDEKYDGMSTEKVYSLLPECQGCSQEGDGDGSQEGDRDGRSSGGGSGEGHQPGCPASRGFRDNHGMWGKDEDDNGLTWRRNLAAAKAAAAGSVPAGMKDYVDEVLNPQLPWLDVLKDNAMASTPSDYAWERPNKRHLWDGLYLPGKKAGIRFEADFYIDVSGSMDIRTDIALCVGGVQEVAELFDEFRLEVSNFECAVTSTKVFETGDDLEPMREVVGRGGTDFDVCLEHSLRDGRKPNQVIILTDGYASWPPSDRGLNVVWVVTHNGRATEEFPFGLVLRLPPPETT